MDDRYLTINKAAAFIGVCRATIYRAIRAGRLPELYYVTKGGGRFLLSELMAAVARLKAKPSDRRHAGVPCG
jgi:excisionase family DNA binding protein